MTRPRIQLTSVTIGTPDVSRLVDFYGELLDWPITAREDGWAQVRPPDGVAGPTLNIEFEAAWRTPVWPGVAGEQHATVHLDLRVDDLDACVAWAQSLGARLADVQPQDGVRVLLDPVGHPFCFFVA